MKFAKGLEEQLLIILADSWPVVPDRDLQKSGIFNASFDLDHSVIRWHEFLGVAEQVEQHLLHALDIADQELVHLKVVVLAQACLFRLKLRFE